jgi:hypothetical protein
MNRNRRRFLGTLAAVGSAGLAGCGSTGVGVTEDSPTENASVPDSTDTSEAPTKDGVTESNTTSPGSLENQHPDAPDIRLENHTGRRINGAIVVTRTENGTELLDEAFTLSGMSEPTDDSPPEVVVEEYVEIVGEQTSMATISTESGYEEQRQFRDEQNNKQLRVKIHTDSIESEIVRFVNNDGA